MNRHCTILVLFTLALVVAPIGSEHGTRLSRARAEDAVTASSGSGWRLVGRIETPYGFLRHAEEGVVTLWNVPSGE
jgi:hypothetical protein